MSRSIIQRRLVDVSDRLRRLRTDLAVVEEQVVYVNEQADDARMRALVAETPIMVADAREARRHADALERHRDSLRATIATLTREQDDLLDRMSAELSAHQA